jgi:hypothetical protein
VRLVLVWPVLLAISDQRNTLRAPAPRSRSRKGVTFRRPTSSAGANALLPRGLRSYGDDIIECTVSGETMGAARRGSLVPVPVGRSGVAYVSEVRGRGLALGASFA